MEESLNDDEFMMNYRLSLEKIKFTSDSISAYLILMKKIALLAKTKQKIEKKQIEIESILSFLSEWKKSNDSTIHQTPMNNMITLLEQLQLFLNILKSKGRTEVQLSPLTTDIVENHFSLIRAKNAVVTCV